MARALNLIVGVVRVETGLQDLPSKGHCPYFPPVKHGVEVLFLKGGPVWVQCLLQVG